MNTGSETLPEASGTAGPKLRKDGQPRQKPGPKPGSRRTAPAPGMRAPSAPKQSAADYRPAILGLLQIPQLGLGLAAKLVKSEEKRTALILDGMTIGVHAAGRSTPTRDARSMRPYGGTSSTRTPKA